LDMDRLEMIDVESEVSSNTDDKLITLFIEHLKLKGSPKSTWSNHRSRLRLIGNYLHTINYSYMTLDKEGLKKIFAYLRSRRHRDKPLSDKAIDNIFSILSSFFSYLAYEEMVAKNPIPDFKKHWLNTYKRDKKTQRRQLITNNQMRTLLNSTLNPLHKAIMVLFAKTGIRRGELISIDTQEIDLEKGNIKLKSGFRKRSNRRFFIDTETALVLSRWMRVRGEYAKEGEKALFVGKEGARIGQNIVYNLVTTQAALLRLHDPKSLNLEDHFSPHCFRHWFTTNLRRNGMKREFIQELRGDARKEAIDIYDHIDPEELKKEYLRCIPRLGII